MTHLQQQDAQLDCNEPHVIVLVTLAGNEYRMPANFARYEDLSQLEDDVVSFLPTVADVEVFGCEVDLLMPDTKLSLRDPIHSTQNRFQVIVRPCIEEGHSVWQFQNRNREGYPKAVRVPINDRKEVPDRAFYSAPMLRHVEVAQGITQIGSAAWQHGKAVISCRLLNCRPLSSVSKMGLFKDAMRSVKSQPQDVSSLVGESLQNAVRSVGQFGQGSHQCIVSRGANHAICLRELPGTHVS